MKAHCCIFSFKLSFALLPTLLACSSSDGAGADMFGATNVPTDTSGMTTTTATDPAATTSSADATAPGTETSAAASATTDATTAQATSGDGSDPTSEPAATTGTDSTNPIDAAATTPSGMDTNTGSGGAGSIDTATGGATTGGAASTAAMDDATMGDPAMDDTTNGTGGADTMATDDPPVTSTDPPLSTRDVFSDPSQCSSGSNFTGREGETMRPGEACNACHTSEHEGPIFAIAGTLYPTGHEPDDCVGVNDDSATVVITDADGMEYELTPNSSGNFSLRRDIPLPYTAKIVTDSAMRIMVTPQDDGDCNSCHSENGLNAAPGRVALP